MLNMMTDNEAEMYLEEDADEEDEDQVNEMCESLYMSSARCYRNFNDFDDDYEGRRLDENLSTETVTEQELTCGFIDNVLNNAFDNTGTINLDQSGWSWKGLSDFNMQNWKSAGEYKKLASSFQNSSVKGWQTALLCLSILGCIAMAIASCVMHGKIRAKVNDSLVNPKIDRVGSGIMSGRSRSEATHKSLV